MGVEQSVFLAPAHAARSASMSAGGVKWSAEPKIASVGHIAAATSSGSIVWPGPWKPSGVRNIP